MTRRATSTSAAIRGMNIRILGARPMEATEGTSETLQTEPSDFLWASSLCGPYYGLPPLEPEEPSLAIVRPVRPSDRDVKPDLGPELLSRNALANSLTVINRLPAELLVKIMGFVQLETGLGSSFGPIHWLKLLWVCRHWFVIGTTTTALWCCIFVRKSLNYARMALARSRQATISFSVYNPYLVSTALPLLTPHARRLRELRLHWDDIYTIDTDQFIAFLNEDMSAIEVLEMHIRLSRVRPIATQVDQPSINFTPTCFPKLRSLTIMSAYIGRQSSIWEQLHTLRLTECLELSVDLLAGIIRKCKNVAHLELLDTTMLPEQGGAPELPRRPHSLASLSALQELRIQLPQAWAVKHLLSILLVPPTAQVTLEWPVHNGTSETDIRSGLLAGLPDDFRGLRVLTSGSTTKGELELSYEHRTLKLTGAAAIEEDAGAEHTPVSGTISISVLNRRVLHADDALRIMRNAPLETLRIAVGGFRLEHIDWHALFRPFDALRRLTVVVQAGRILYSIIRIVLSALDVQDGGGGNGQHLGIPCPALRYVRIEGIGATRDSGHREELVYARDCLLRRQILLDRTALDGLVLVVSAQDWFEEGREMAVDLLAPVVGSLEYQRDPNDEPDAKDDSGRRKGKDSGLTCTIL